MELLEVEGACARGPHSWRHHWLDIWYGLLFFLLCGCAIRCFVGTAQYSACNNVTVHISISPSLSSGHERDLIFVPCTVISAQKDKLQPDNWYNGRRLVRLYTSLRLIIIFIAIYIFIDLHSSWYSNTVCHSSFR